MPAIALMATAFLVVPVGGQPLGAYIAVPIASGVSYVAHLIHKPRPHDHQPRQQKLKHRPDSDDAAAQDPDCEI